ncbi:MAG: acetyl-CoA carboxylase biotin carboxylase subunit [Acidimicrobiia bacterium]|nr:acetyl-CoA carboxylase biotin carboxylase subunit [Acidimicrobiia bacterium]MYG59070.1 acetyl-CoA carboxylase biotin carboxylase subunit [Acidimicrobiia bacterium]MYJ33204.1 acetyl-CoA carboxylase biotin carboxylase subunit [Acidimicrobiia bacterium]
MKKLLVANRGEIALRVIRAAEELGIPTVAVYSDADEQARHVSVATEAVHIGPAPAAQSYLNTDAILSAAKRSNADSLHPGYGFLSENADFARRCEAEGICFVGPSPSAISLMGDKAAARETAVAAGVPIVPGTLNGIESPSEAEDAAKRIGFPLLIKAAAGGGGRGIRIVNAMGEFADQVVAAQTEARASFGDDTVYLERFIDCARHVEVQIFGDGRQTVHLFERECSLQRRRQKLIEEALAPNLPANVRFGLTAAAVALSDAVYYEGAGTVEFLFDPATNEFFFIEMNTRIQVEHPVTEFICGLDLVREQLRQAQGLPMSFSQSDVQPRGASIEMRINAEDPDNNFMPSPGTITDFELPLGPGVRISTPVKAGSQVSPFYDSLIAKIIVWDVDRMAALSRARRAMHELHIKGVKTTASLISALLSTDEVKTGRYDTGFVERWLGAQEKGSDQ